jgi:hypothetical protein
VGIGYNIKWEKTASLSTINEALDSVNVAIWAHTGHGKKGKLLLGQKWIMPSAFKSNHRLAAIFLYSCQAVRGNWKHLSHFAGYIFASEYNINPDRAFPSNDPDLHTEWKRWYELPKIK